MMPARLARLVHRAFAPAERQPSSNSPTSRQFAGAILAKQNDQWTILRV